MNMKPILVIGTTIHNRHIILLLEHVNAHNSGLTAKPEFRREIALFFFFFFFLVLFWVRLGNQG